MSGKFRKKPVVIEAKLYTGDNFESMDEWIEGGFYGYDQINDILWIKTLEGTMNANPGDWIIKGVNGEYYPCKSDIFEKSYEEVKE